MGEIEVAGPSVLQANSRRNKDEQNKEKCGSRFWGGERRREGNGYCRVMPIPDSSTELQMVERKMHNLREEIQLKNHIENYYKVLFGSETNSSIHLRELLPH